MGALSRSRSQSSNRHSLEYSKLVRGSFSDLRTLRDLYPTPTRNYPPRTMQNITSPAYKYLNTGNEDQPLRKYDVYSLRTWTYPIWKYRHFDTSHDARASYWLKSHYSTPIVSMDFRPRVRRYTDHTYLGDESGYNVVSRTQRRPASTLAMGYGRWRIQHTPSWYWSYYGHSGLRHFAAYRRY